MGRFGERFAFCRNLNGLSQTKAAKLLGIAQSSLSAYEADRSEPGMSAINSMCNLYGVSADFLLGRTNKTELASGGFIDLDAKRGTPTDK